MKIGVLTLPLNYNYGGILQAYALQTILCKLGHDAKLIENHWAILTPQISPKTRYLVYIKNFLLRYLLNKDVYVRPDYEMRKRIKFLLKNTQYFIDKHIEFVTIKKNDIYDLENIKTFIVGSDQVWRREYITNDYLKYFFEPLSDKISIKRIAYSASFGIDEWDYTDVETQKCAELAKKFDLVTVRENSGIEMCKKYLGVNASMTLDPTLLLEKQDYINLVEQEKESKRTGNLFYYILDETPEKLALVDRVANEYHLTPFKTMPYSQPKKFEYNERYCYPKITEWLRSFMDAKFVVTDSFHGCVFSIIFNKPFLAIGNKDRGMARFNSLLKLFQLKNRLTFIENGEYLYNNSEIDWNKVNSIHTEWKNKSIDLLKSTLVK